ncbi:MAG TPA: hypothetical protein VIM12_16940 [Noviherbaspirillum sp.]
MVTYDELEVRLPGERERPDVRDSERNESGCFGSTFDGVSLPGDAGE